MIAGVDIGGTKIAVAGFERDSAGRLQRTTDVRTRPTPAESGGAAIVRAVGEAVTELSATSLTAIGVGTAGVVAPDGSILSSTGAIHGWAGYPLRGELESLIAAPVTVLNDVHAAAVAEAAVGAAASAESALVVTVGTGIGGAVVLGDGLRPGRTGTAGSIGHMEIEAPAVLAGRRCPCGMPGHVEAVASGPGMEQTYRERTGRTVTLREIDRLARDGDALAEEVIAEGARFLAQALTGAAALLDMEMIVIGGGVAQIGERYLRVVEGTYRERAMPGPAGVRLVPAELGVDATLTGAALWAAKRTATTAAS